MEKRQWADQYGSQWYKHYDGKPPHDDDNDYRWDGFSWSKIDDFAEQDGQNYSSDYHWG